MFKKKQKDDKSYQEALGFDADQYPEYTWQVGEQIAGRYKVLDIKGGPGKSGMGIVYVAIDQQTAPLITTIPDQKIQREIEYEFGYKFAVKTYQNKFLFDAQTVNRFIREAEIWIKLGEHKNIVKAYYLRKIEGKPYIFTEFIDGGDLHSWIGKTDIQQSLDFAMQFCAGMDYAYKKLGIIHRDIKPGNILITKDKTVKITDFGLASAIRERTEIFNLFKHESSMVSSGMGTLSFMPPEQFPKDIQKQFGFKPKPITIRTDIYSFGITFYYLLTGTRPTCASGYNNNQIISNIFTKAPLSPMKVNVKIPPKLDRIIMKCLEKDPKDRFRDFRELMEILKEI